MQDSAEGKVGKSEKTQKVYQKVQSSYTATIIPNFYPLALACVVGIWQDGKGGWSGNSWAGWEMFVYTAAQLLLRFREAVSLSGGHDTSGSTLLSEQEHPWHF